MWRHNGHDGVSNHQPQHCLLNRFFGGRWKKISKLRVTGLCAGNNSPHKWPVTRKIFPLYDVIMVFVISVDICHLSTAPGNATLNATRVLFSEIIVSTCDYGYSLPNGSVTQVAQCMEFGVFNITFEDCHGKKNIVIYHLKLRIEKVLACRQ